MSLYCLCCEIWLDSSCSPALLQISQKRWKVDTNSRQDSVLMLSAVNLPGGVQVRDPPSFMAKKIPNNFSLFLEEKTRV